MNWLIIYEIVYILMLILVCLRIIYDTRTNAKTLAYLMLVLFLPLIGILFYFSFGTNYRKRKIYTKKLIQDETISQKLKADFFQYSKHNFEQADPEIQSTRELALMLVKNGMSPFTVNNDVKLLINGENKFPSVLEALSIATEHIHIEYYSYEDDEIGSAIESILIQKVLQGVTVRIIYDDFGSRSVRKRLIPHLKKMGIKAFPFYKVTIMFAANRMNYRNHRKIIVIDGKIGFVGGINISDKYINKPSGEVKQYWRDTHLRIEGPGVLSLQHLFLGDWNFCAKDYIQFNETYFPKLSSYQAKGNKKVQIAASGPDSDTPTILFSILQAINLATTEILITTPYFIPGESILDALMIASLGGVSVKLLVPGISDSMIVNAAARSYYEDLLAAGVEIHLYKKGFVHAKTLVADKKISIVGTANMDQRSFDLNFEVNAVVYDQEIGIALSDVFYEDLKDAEQIDIDNWKKRSWYNQLTEKTARLLSPLL